LAAFLLAQAAIPLDNLINYGEAFRLVALDISPNLFFTFGLAYWLEAPLLLLYIRSIIYKDFKLVRKDLWMFVPFILYAMYFSYDWLSLDTQTKMMALQGDTIAQSDILSRAIHFSREALRVFFGILCLMELHKYQKQVKNEVANMENVDLTWLKMLTIGFLVLRINAVFVALAIIFSYELGYNVNHEILGLTANYAVMLLISGLSFFSAGFSPIFKGIDGSLTESNEKDKEPIDQQHVALIENYMINNKPYLNPLLTLDNLSNQLELPSRTVSVTLNRHFDKNFYEFVNFYRIEESKTLLTSAKHRKTTMLDVMDRVGFNSKATFNTFFKKLVGVTPTQFRKDYWQNQPKSDK